MFQQRRFQRVTSSIVLTAFVSMIMTPMHAAASVPAPVSQVAGPAVPLGPEEQFASVLAAMHDELKAVTPLVAMARGGAAPQGVTASRPAARMAPLAGTMRGERLRKVRAHGEAARRLFPVIEQGLQENLAHLRRAGLPAVILQRQAEATAALAQRRAEFERLVDGLERTAGTSDEGAALDALAAFMARHQSAKSHQYGNPDKLPFGLQDKTVRAPKTSKQGFEESLFAPAAAPAVAMLSTTQANVPAAPDLAETEDVQLTPAVRAKAIELQRNPVKIYNWVRNNIDYVPSYGSIQGSEMTLHNKRGNAFDTASLLIALYRASGIPARYAYGTIEVPAAQVMNWVGGVTKPEAAQSLLGQGGIPNIGRLSGGVVGDIRMEHVWVQAYVDYSPSRAAVNRAPSTWVSVDPSFKQYTYAPGMDVAGAVQFDGQAALAQALQGATVDASTGSVQNVNMAEVQTRIAAYQARVKTYVDGQKPGATVNEVLGAPKTIVAQHAILLGTLPYTTVAIGSQFSAIPDRLRWKFKTNIYAADGMSDPSAPIIEVNQSTAALAGKKITLSFTAATQADQDLINSYMPKAHPDGSPIQPSEMPTSLPGYLLKMKAEFRIDGQVVAQSSQSMSMGSEVMQSGQFYNPAHGAWEGGSDNAITVGEYNAIGIDLQGMGGHQLKAHQAKLDATKARLTRYQLNPADSAAVEGLGKEEVTGDVLHSGIIGYFAQIDASDRLAARVSDTVVAHRLPSYGRFFTAAQTSYWFGIAKKVTFPGIGIDVDYISYHTEAKDADRDKRTAYIRMTGAASSAAEHAVPELMFRNPNLAASDAAQPRGVSAVKALAEAARLGQRIYQLTADNREMHSNVVQGLQISQDVKWEITNALNNGKEVTVHERDLSLGGWTGSGYLILDADTGAGAYKIAGGANGGGVWWLGAIGGASVAVVLGIAAFLASVAAATAGALIFFWVLIAVIVLATVALMLMNMSDMTDEDKACYLGGILTGFAFGGLFNMGRLLGILLAVIGIGTTGGAATSPSQQCGAW